MAIDSQQLENAGRRLAELLMEEGLSGEGVLRVLDKFEEEVMAWPGPRPRQEVLRVARQTCQRASS